MILSSHKPLEGGSCRNLDVKSKKQHWPNIAGTFYPIRKNGLVFISSQSQACFKQMEKIPFALHLLELCRGHQEQPETKTSLSPSRPSTAGHPHYHQQQAILTIINSRWSSLSSTTRLSSPPSTAGHHDHPGNQHNHLHCHCQNKDQGLHLNLRGRSNAIVQVYNAACSSYNSGRTGGQHVAGRQKETKLCRIFWVTF